MAVKFTNAQIIEGLNSVNGMVYLAARKIGCNPQTIYNRMKTNTAIREACDNARGELIDISEQKLRGCFERRTLGGCYGAENARQVARLR